MFLIGDAIVVVCLMLLCYKAVLYVARFFERRAEDLVEDVKKGAHPHKPKKETV